MIIIASIFLLLVVTVIYVTELQARREARRKAMRDSVKAQFPRARQPRRDEILRKGALWLDDLVREVESADTKKRRK